MDSTSVAAHQDAAGAPKAAPNDVSAERLAVALTQPTTPARTPVDSREEAAFSSAADHTGGCVE